MILNWFSGTEAWSGICDDVVYFVLVQRGSNDVHKSYFTYFFRKILFKRVSLERLNGSKPINPETAYYQLNPEGFYLVRL